MGLNVDEESAMELRQSQSKSLTDLKMQEHSLQTQLENLKKETFSLKTSIQAWKTTHEQKQKELAEVESKLNEIYNEIWSEREKFCARADEFNNQYGILSKWWEERMDEIFDLGKVENLKVLEKEDKPPEIFDDVDSPKAENFVFNRKDPKKSSPETVNRRDNASPAQENDTTKDAYNKSDTMEFTEVLQKLKSPERQLIGGKKESTLSDMIEKNAKKKKVQFSKEGDKIEIINQTLKINFFSLVDIEMVKKANRVKNRRKSQSFGQVVKSTNKCEAK